MASSKAESVLWYGRVGLRSSLVKVGSVEWEYLRMMLLCGVVWRRRVIWEFEKRGMREGFWFWLGAIVVMGGVGGGRRERHLKSISFSLVE